LSFGSRGETWTDSSFETLFINATRVDAIAAAQRRAGEIHQTRDLLGRLHGPGSNSSARKVWTQAKTPLASNRASRKNVRQKRLSAARFCGMY
jgi:hypothetical protein